MLNEIFHILSDSKINYRIEKHWDWDNGVDFLEFFLEDPYGRGSYYYNSKGGYYFLKIAVRALADRARQIYPKSEFAKWWRERNAN